MSSNKRKATEAAEGPASKKPSSTSAPGSNNSNIHKMLLELAETERAKGEKFKSSAYVKAARAIKECKEEITSGKQAKQLKDIGEKIAKKIDELLATGTLERLERDRADVKTLSLKELQRVSGVGAKFAEKLFTEHGIKDLRMLEKRTDLLSHEQKVRHRCRCHYR
jgi:DNA polymerase/3'-5' exonuclease PolX